MHHYKSSKYILIDIRFRLSGHFLVPGAQCCWNVLTKFNFPRLSHLLRQRWVYHWLSVVCTWKMNLVNSSSELTWLKYLIIKGFSKKIFFLIGQFLIFKNIVFQLIIVICIFHFPLMSTNALKRFSFSFGI